MRALRRTVAGGKATARDGCVITQFDEIGALRFDQAASPVLDQLEFALRAISGSAAGVRLRDIEGLQPLLAADGPIGSLAAKRLGSAVQPVRAVLFNKSEATNWSLGWHQDRTICVRARVEAPGFGPWTIKQGLHHVAPPIDVLQRMLTLRVHLDDVPADNAPLLIAPGSHRLGMVPVDRIEHAVAHRDIQACLAKAGDVWMYATLILHASEASVTPSGRRVLQIDYAGFELPFGLEWLGV